MSVLQRFLRRLWHAASGQHDARFQEELDDHLERQVTEYVQTGLSPQEARRKALLQFGSIEAIRESHRAEYRLPGFDQIVQDTRYAVRRLLRAPVFSLAAILSLALGIGANAAVFSLFNEALVRPLPVPDPDGLVNLSATGPRSGHASSNMTGGGDEIFNYQMFRALERARPDVAIVAAHRTFDINAEYGGETFAGQGEFVSGGYFSALNLRPVLGRLLGSDDDRRPGDSPVAVLSYSYWTNHFAAAHEVIGKTLVVNGEALTIVGVAPKEFRGTTLGNMAQVFVPITMRGRLEPPFEEYDDRMSYWAYLFARLRPGVSVTQAETALNEAYRATIINVEAPTIRLEGRDKAKFLASTLHLAPGAHGQSLLTRTVAAPLTVLFVVAGVVLVIACGNVANLLLARTAARTPELALRASIGASRGRLVSQLLVESLILSVVGGGLGLAIGRLAFTLGGDALAPMGVPPMTVHLDARVVWFAAALSLATGLSFGVFPALYSTRTALASRLSGQSGRLAGTRSAARFRGTMIVVQMALSTALLVAAGLFLRSLVNVSRVDLGIKIDHLMTFTLVPIQSGYSGAAGRALAIRIEDALRAAPGVEIASVSTIQLIGGSGSSTSDIGVEGVPPDESSRHLQADYTAVGPRFFGTIGMPLVAGREFNEGDAINSAKVVIVNERFVKTFAPGVQVIGRRFGSHLDKEIVGVVRDAKYEGVKADTPPVFYTAYRLDASLRRATFYVRTPLAPESIAATIRATVKSVDPKISVHDLRTMSDQVRENITSDRIVTTLAASFALIATLLASVGLYGVLAYTVTQRTREFGVRIALGATPAQVRQIVLANVGRLVLVGGVSGLLLAAFGGRYVRSLLFEVAPIDPSVFAVVGLLLALVALAAGFAPAWRASRIDPMITLRQE